MKKNAYFIIPLLALGALLLLAQTTYMDNIIIRGTSTVTGSLDCTGGTCTGFGGGGTDSSYVRYWTAAGVPNVADGLFVGPGWISDTPSIFADNGIPYRDLSISPTGGTHYAYIGVPVPAGWTGSVALKALFTVRNNAVGSGTGTHQYTLACWTPVTFALNGTPSWQTVSTVNWTIATNANGALDVPTFTGGQIPTCSSGDTMLFRVIRADSGTAAPDQTLLYYFDISLPHTVQ